MALFYTSTRSKKKPSKPTAAQRALAEAEAKMLAKHAKPLELGAKAKGVKVVAVKVTPATPVPTERAKKNYESLRGVAALKETQQYTGTKMLGLGQMHKSNQVPVFSSEEAIDIAKMRRG